MQILYSADFRRLLFILLSYSSGILVSAGLGRGWGITDNSLLAILLIALPVLVLLSRRIPLFPALILALICGGLRASCDLYPEFPRPHLALYTGYKSNLVRGYLTSAPEVFPDKIRLCLEAQEIEDDKGTRTPVSGSLLLTLRDRPAFRLHYGDRVEFIGSLYRPRRYANPGVFNYPRYLAAECIYVQAFLNESRKLKIIGREPGHILRYRLEGMREHINQIITQYTQPPGREVIRALIVGDRGLIPKAINDSMRRIGLAHILAISGLQVGLVAFLCYEIFKWLLKRSVFILLVVNIRRLAAFGAIFPMLLYTYIAGAEVSVVRAALMTLTYLAAVVFGRESELIHSLILAAFLILLYQPLSLFHVAFQLSFISVAAIIILYPPLYQLVFPPLSGLNRPITISERLSRWFISYVLVSLVAWLGVMPLVAYHFNNISLLSLPANTLLVPILGAAAVYVGLAGVMAGLILPPLGRLILFLEERMVNLGLDLAALLDRLPADFHYVPSPSLFSIAAFYILLIVPLLSITRRKKIRLALILMLLLVSDPLQNWLRHRLSSNLTISFLDVGRGDAALIQAPGGVNIMMDGGGQSVSGFNLGESVVAPFLWHRRITRLDYLILSHPQEDHYGGFLFLARHFRPRVFIMPTVAGLSMMRIGLIEILEQEKIPLKTLNAASPPLRIDKNLTLYVLNPQLDKNYDQTDINESSLVILMRFHAWRVLLTGDIGTATEKALIADHPDLNADLLKVPHHGSTHSNSLEFLQTVRPALAVAMNRLSVPGYDAAPMVYKRYRNLDIPLVGTNRSGMVTVILSPNAMRVKTYLPPPHPALKDKFPILRYYPLARPR